MDSQRPAEQRRSSTVAQAEGRQRDNPGSFQAGRAWRIRSNAVEGTAAAWRTSLVG
jgi:hypothetical protein